MNESTSVTSSSLAITEKRPRRTSGCVGIFFQLFDWNRRFAKKKLFSKRLLPPDRAKEASKKFGGDEKLPKLRLIADENSGGFPNMNKNGVSSLNSSEGKNGVQTPSLVARLMGLESMPSVQRDKLKKDSSGEFSVGRREKVVGDSDEFEKETTRQEFRPQKLQKTGMVERRTVTRFGAEALQLKNALSRSRKHHHPKLASPVKSTSHHSRRNTSRLIGAATRILEPGLQARNKAKCAITYTHNARRPLGNELRSESMKREYIDLSGTSNPCTNTTMFSRGQASCKNCGNLLDVAESTSNRDVHASVFDSVDPSSQVLENGNSRYVCTSFDQEQELSTNRMPVDHGCHVQWHSTDQQSESQNFASPIYFKNNTRKLADVSLRGDGVPYQSKLNCLPFNRVASATDAVSDTKDFVALNRSLSGRTRLRVPAKVEDTRFDRRSKFDSGRDNCLSPGQKRQFTHIRKQGENSGMVGSSNNRPRMVSSIASTGKQMRPDACSVGRIHIERQPDHQGQSNRIGGGGNKNNDGMAFRFSSPMKQRGEVPTKVERRRNVNASPCKTTPCRKSISNQSDEKICMQNPFPLTGDSLGALLEEKLKELTSQMRGESGMNSTTPKRTTANIFRDLICALNMERPLPQNDMKFSPQRNYLPHHCSSSRSDQNPCFCLQTKSEKTGALVGYKHSDHLSPGSVLEASFSNDSCCSSSLDDSSGHAQHADSLSYSYDESQLLDSETCPFCSGVSLSKEKTRSELVSDLLIYMSKVLSSMDHLDARLKGNKRMHAKEVIFNAELVFGNQMPHNSTEINSFFISHFLLDELETLTEVLWKNLSNFLGFENLKQGYQLKGFVFDCLIEYLDSKYVPYSKCGFRAWTNLPPCMNSEILIHEVVEEVKRWMGFFGLIPDDLIERDMSHCLGKWTDFEIEAFENGAGIELDILQMLVDEFVIDLTTGFAWRAC